jgi:hypothetical protein
MKRQEFIHEMEARLKGFDAQMERLVARPRPAGERARQELEKTYFLLKARRSELREQLRHMTTLPEDGWDAFRHSVERMYADMSHSMDLALGGAEATA